MASPSPPSSPLLSPSLPPAGPLCAYGQRLAYTYFDQVNLQAEELNLTQETCHFFTVDDQLVYLSFFKDRGPLNAACLYRFCLHVHTLLEDPALKSKRIILYSSSEPDKKANAALLIALYAMIVMRWTPADVLHPISGLELQPYRDAGYSRADFHLSLQSTLFGISKAINLRLLDLSSFDLAAYETYEKVENGDWNWLTPGFVAFASPSEPGWSPTSPFPSTSGKGKGIERGVEKKLNQSFKNVLEEFEKAGVKAVVRLNKKLYDKRHFEARGMEHHEMYFDDGTNPTLSMTRDFIALAERVFATGGAVAVHCKAGLGRTGTLIGAWLIYKHGFTASEAIGFMRLMRPGSCVGPQQHYLYENQMTYIRWAAVDEHLLTHIPSPLSTRLSLSVIQPSPSPPTSKQVGDRPLTPPTEADLAQSRSASSRHSTPQPSTPPPSTTVPRTPGGGGLVPGQPRKTPGKSKHSVARPERRDSNIPEFEDEVDGPRLEDREELMLVKDEEEDGDKMEGVMGTPVPECGPRMVLGVSDNRIEGGSPIGGGELARSPKVVRGLVASTGARYELRGAVTTAATISTTTISNATQLPVPASTVMNPSPSRLPTRIGVKRRGGGGASVQVVVGGGGGGGVGGRAGRKRKSAGAAEA